MALTVTDLRTLRSDADAITNWTGVSMTLFTTDPPPVEASGHLGNVVSTTTGDCYHAPGGTVDLTGKLIYIWALPLGAMDSLANGGVGVYISDGTNARSYSLAGNDVAVFRHNAGQPLYECLVLDLSSLPASYLQRLGSGAPNFAAVTAIGVTFKTLTKSKGGVANCWVDIVRIFDPATNDGCVLAITGGTSGAPGTFEDIATDDASTATGKAYGVVRKLGAGTYGVQGPLRFGEPTGSSDSWFVDKNVTVIFESRGLTTSRYKILIVDNGTGTATFKLGTKVGSGVAATGADGVVITAAAGVGWLFDAATDADVTDVFIYGSTFSGATGGVKLRAGQEFIGGVIALSGRVDADGATMVNTAISTPAVAAGASALGWNVATDPDGYLDGMTFAKGAADHHAIELGTNSPTTITLRGVNFSGFTNTVGHDAAPLYIKRTGGTVTVNLIGCSGLSVDGYKSDGAAVVIVINPVDVTVQCKDLSGDPVAEARVYLEAAPGGPFPCQEEVTIENAGGTASVTHTGHGLATNDWVCIRGAALDADNGIFQITVDDADHYHYTTS